jgi:hypothetical protein
LRAIEYMACVHIQLRSSIHLLELSKERTRLKDGLLSSPNTGSSDKSHCLSNASGILNGLNTVSEDTSLAVHNNCCSPNRGSRDYIYRRKCLDNSGEQRNKDNDDCQRGRHLKRECLLLLAARPVEEADAPIGISWDRELQFLQFLSIQFFRSEKTHEKKRKHENTHKTRAHERMNACDEENLEKARIKSKEEERESFA